MLPELLWYRLRVLGYQRHIPTHLKVPPLLQEITDHVNLIFFAAEGANYFVTIAMVIFTSVKIIFLCLAHLVFN